MKNGLRNLTAKSFAKFCILHFAFCIICGCSPQQKLNRLYERNPQLFTNDTVVISDTLVIPSKSIEHKAALPVGIDTVIHFENPQSKMRGELQVKYNDNKDTVFINTAVETIPYAIPYTKTLITNNQPKTIHQVERPSWWKFWVGIAIGLLGFIALKYIEFIIFKKQ